MSDDSKHEPAQLPLGIAWAQRSLKGEDKFVVVTLPSSYGNLSREAKELLSRKAVVVLNRIEIVRRDEIREKAPRFSSGHTLAQSNISFNQNGTVELHAVSVGDSEIRKPPYDEPVTRSHNLINPEMREGLRIRRSESDDDFDIQRLGQLEWRQRRSRVNMRYSMADGDFTLKEENVEVVDQTVPAKGSVFVSSDGLEVQGLLGLSMVNPLADRNNPLPTKFGAADVVRWAADRGSQDDITSLEFILEQPSRKAQTSQAQPTRMGVVCDAHSSSYMAIVATSLYPWIYGCEVLFYNYQTNILGRQLSEIPEEDIQGFDIRIITFFHRNLERFLNEALPETGTRFDKRFKRRTLDRLAELLYEELGKSQIYTMFSLEGYDKLEDFQQEFSEIFFSCDLNPIDKSNTSIHSGGDKGEYKSDFRKSDFKPLPQSTLSNNKSMSKWKKYGIPTLGVVGGGATVFFANQVANQTNVIVSGVLVGVSALIAAYCLYSLISRKTLASLVEAGIVITAGVCSGSVLVALLEYQTNSLLSGNPLGWLICIAISALLALGLSVMRLNMTPELPAPS